jgi:hypothetical protein
VKQALRANQAPCIAARDKDSLRTLDAYTMIGSLDVSHQGLLDTTLLS